MAVYPTAGCLTAITRRGVSTGWRTAAGFRAARTASTRSRWIRRARLGAGTTARPRDLSLQVTQRRAVLRIVRRDTEALLGRQGFPGLRGSPRGTRTRVLPSRALPLPTA